MACGFFHDHGHATAPLLDQAELTKYTADDSIAQAADPTRKILDAQAGDENPWVFDLDPIVEERYSDRCTALGIVGMHQSICESFPQAGQGNAPAVHASKPLEFSGTHRMLLEEG